MPTAFITGCGTGFGHRLAKALLASGWSVIATDPETDGLGAALGEPNPKLIVLPLDLRHALSIDRATAAAVALGPIDLLVNNGGFAVFGNVEAADLDAVREMFEVNVFGLGRVTSQLLPSIRAQGGTIVNLSSIAGRLVFPESGWYAASKHAVEALSAALYQECRSFGVRVRVIEPGAFATQFSHRAAAHSQPRNDDGPYSADFAEWDARKQKALVPPQDPNRVVDAIVASLADPTPFMRILVGDDAMRLLGQAEDPAPDAWQG